MKKYLILKLACLYVFSAGVQTISAQFPKSDAFYGNPLAGFVAP